MAIPTCDVVCGSTPVSSLAALLFIAGEVEFDGSVAPATFAFTTPVPGPEGLEFTPIPLGTLDPASNLFASPSPGVLEYVGAVPLRVQASYSLNLVWLSATGGITETPFGVELLHNGERVGESGQSQVLDQTDSDNVFGKSSSTMLVLQPGDTLQVGVSALAPATYEVLITSLTLGAHKV
jgi:hypothetical protein